MQALTTIHSTFVPLPLENIDTDQIIPARFLTTTTKEGLGRRLFSDWRYRPDGSPNLDFVLNRPEAEGCTVLVAGRNFGCGSSREHAPWALRDYGFEVVISSEIADIFRSNSLKNGLLPVVVDETTLAQLLACPGAEVEVDLASTTLTLADGHKVAFTIDAFARHCLLHGVDELGFILGNQGAIEAFERDAAR